MMESCATPGRSQPGERSLRRRQGRSDRSILQRSTTPRSGMVLRCPTPSSSRIEGTRSTPATRHARLDDVLRTAVCGLLPPRLLRCLHLSRLKARVRPRSRLRTERQREKLCGRGPSRRAPGNVPMSGVRPPTPGGSALATAGPSRPANLVPPGILGDTPIWRLALDFLNRKSEVRALPGSPMFSKPYTLFQRHVLRGRPRGNAQGSCSLII